jgi:putative lipid kinase YegS-like protein
VIRPGRPWGHATTSPPDVVCRGDDAALAGAVRAHPGALLQLVANEESDLARAVGLRVTDDGDAHEAKAGGTELTLDAIRDDAGGLAVNAVIVGPSPDRLRAFHRARWVRVTIDGRVRYTGPATTVVVASGQYLRGSDLVPRSHPGDGILEIQAYALGPAQRAGMRRRLGSGTHLPHPGIRTWRGRSVHVEARRALRIERDRHPGGRTRSFTAEVDPASFRLLV